MGINEQIADWLENRWVTCLQWLVAGGIALCFFGAAINTMAGGYMF